ncbi:class I SAM-dependent methyltransferase [Candidatus Bathyarchaeota archaeon]|nr:class I SAM-dependent methyltransferase [Candidatus Bathyarchaeota archaeon]
MRKTTYRAHVKSFALKLLDKLPIKLQHFVYQTKNAKIKTEMRFTSFKIKHMRFKIDGPNPDKMYWIATDRIKYLTNYAGNRKIRTSNIVDIDFKSEKMRGKIVDGNWDLTDNKFTDLDLYKAFQKRKLEGSKWQDTDFYKGVLKKIESRDFVYGLRNKDDLDKRCEYLDWLYDKIETEGYALNQNNYDKNTTFDEIDVNIGRYGEYLLQNGIYQLSVAKILGIKNVPVRVFVRHKEWWDLRKLVISYAKHISDGLLYQPIVHPDLADIPYNLPTHNYEMLAKVIKSHLHTKNGAMLDIGTNTGFFCHKFEDLGYICYGIEQDPAAFQILEKIRIAENKKFVTINKSIFDVEFVKTMQFDVVLAFNIFHHFLKRKTLYLQLIDLLKSLKTNELFFEPHLVQEDFMKDAYVNYNPDEFVEFILQHTRLSRSEVVYIDPSGRIVFHLF